VTIYTALGNSKEAQRVRNKIMQTIQASEFKAKCLALMDEVARTGEVWVVTKNGRPVAELRPFGGPRVDSPFGLHRGLRIEGDILSPLEEPWDAQEAR
jgi:prevent-host-death family protein